MQKLDPKAVAIALGGTWAIGLIILALVAIIHGQYGSSIISLISTVYVGYRDTIPGALIGGIWGFVDGAVCGYVFAWIYNKNVK